MTQTGPTTTQVTSTGGTTIVTPPLKPGFRTSEFVVTVLTSLALLAAALADALPPRYAAIGSAVSVGAYSIARGLAKVYPPKSGA